MAYERTRQKLGLGPEVNDEEVLRRGYVAARTKRPGMTAAEYRTRLQAYEGAGATAAPPAPPVPPAAPAANRAAPVTPLAMLQGAGNFVRNAAVEMGKDALAVPRATFVDPIRQLARIPQAMAQGRVAQRTPEEVDTSRRSAAFLAGNAAGGLGGALGKTAVAGLGSRALRMALEGGIGGATGGAADATLRSGDVRQAPGGAVVGGALGTILGGAASRIKPKAAPAPASKSSGSGAAFERAFPEEYADVVSGKLQPSEAILKALGQGVLIEDASLDQMARELAEHARVQVEAPTVIPKSSGKAKNPLRSVGGRLEESGPGGREVLRRVKEADTVALTEAGPVNRRLREAGMGRLKHEEDRALGYALRGQLAPEEAVTPRVGAVRGEARGYLGGVVPRAQEAGLPTGDLGENYFPENMVDVEHLGRGGPLAQLIAGGRRMLGDKTATANPIRDDVLDNMLRLRAAPDLPGAEAMTDDWIRFVKSKGEVGGELAVPDPDMRQRALRHYMERRANLNPNLDFAREVSTPFYDPSPSRVLPRYVEGAERRIAEATQYGPKGEKITSVIAGITNPEERARVKHLAESATGLAEESDTDLARGLEMARRYSATKLNPASSALNLTQNLNSLYASDAPSFVKGIGRAMTKHGGDLAIDSGAISETALANVRHAIRPGHDFVDTYLKGIGFTPIERMNRRIAANVGWTYAQKMAKRLKANPNDAFAKRELAALELDAEKIVKAGGLDEKDLIRAAKVFVDRTQFRQREIDLPQAFTSSALGRNITQFKGFSYQQGQFLAREILDGLRSSDPRAKAKAARNAALVLSLAPLVGETVGNARAFILGKERKKEGFARYIENLANAGGLGLVLDALQSAEYGNVPGFIGGPTASTIADVGTVAYNAGRRAIDKGKGPTAGETRTLVRALPGGAVAANRVAPPKEKKVAGARPERPTTRPERKERP